MLEPRRLRRDHVRRGGAPAPAFGISPRRAHPFLSRDLPARCLSRWQDRLQAPPQRAARSVTLSLALLRPWRFLARAFQLWPPVFFQPFSLPSFRVLARPVFLLLFSPHPGLLPLPPAP